MTMANVDDATQLDPTPSDYVEYIYIGFVRCKHLLATHNTELIHCNSN